MNHIHTPFPVAWIPLRSCTKLFFPAARYSKVLPQEEKRRAHSSSSEDEILDMRMISAVGVE